MTGAQEHVPVKFIAPVEWSIFHSHPLIHRFLGKDVVKKIKSLLKRSGSRFGDIEEKPEVFEGVSDTSFMMVCLEVVFIVDEESKNFDYELYNFYSNLENYLDEQARAQIAKLEYPTFLEKSYYPWLWLNRIMMYRLFVFQSADAS